MVLRKFIQNTLDFRKIKAKNDVKVEKWFMKHDGSCRGLELVAN